MPFEIHHNSERGHVRQGWLKSAHSFSFAHYYNERRMNFGALLVLNEDTIAPAAGFGEHAHDNMEIITIPLSGSLQHSDSMGNSSVIQAGDIQIMSAGTGIRHSEKNASTTEPVHLLQIWIIPNVQGLPTRYDEITLDVPRSENAFALVVAPQAAVGTLMIHQDAYFYLGRFTTGYSFSLQQHNKEHGTFFFVISGSVIVNGKTLQAGDAYTLWDETDITGTAQEDSHILAIEVPMKIIA